MLPGYLDIGLAFMVRVSVALFTVWYATKVLTVGLLMYGQAP